MSDNINESRAENAGMFARMMNSITLGRAVLLGIILIGLAFLFVSVEGWRGKAAFERYASDANSRGQTINLDAYIPPTISDSENFAQTPALAPLFDFKPGSQKWKDTNATAEILGWEDRFRGFCRAKGFEISKNRVPRFEAARPLNLIELFEVDKPAKDAAASIPSTQKEAARALVDLINDFCGPALNELQDASRNSKARFGIKYESAPISEIMLPHLAVLKNRCQLLTLRAVSLLALGEPDKAYDDLRLILYLSDSIKGEPFLISHLVRISCRAIAASVVWQGMLEHRWSDAQLRQLQTGFLADDFPADGFRSLLAERACAMRLIEQFRTRASATTVDQAGFSDGRNSTDNFTAMIPSGWYYLEALNVCLCYDEFLSAINDWLHGKQDYQSVIARTAESADALAQSQPGNPIFVVREVLWKHRFMARMLVPAVAKSFSKAIQIQARTELMIGACALERYYLEHAEYPASLDKLMPAYLNKLPKDPYSGSSLHYRRSTPTSFLLYSVGPNGVDDGGTVDIDKKGVVNPDKGDLIWSIGAN